MVEKFYPVTTAAPKKLREGDLDRWGLQIHQQSEKLKGSRPAIHIKVRTDAG